MSSSNLPSNVNVTLHLAIADSLRAASTMLRAIGAGEGNGYLSHVLADTTRCEDVMRGRCLTLFTGGGRAHEGTPQFNPASEPAVITIAANPPVEPVQTTPPALAAETPVKPVRKARVKKVAPVAAPAPVVVEPAAPVAPPAPEMSADYEGTRTPKTSPPAVPAKDNGPALRPIPSKSDKGKPLSFDGFGREAIVAAVHRKWTERLMQVFCDQYGFTLPPTLPEFLAQLNSAASAAGVFGDDVGIGEKAPTQVKASKPKKVAPAAQDDVQGTSEVKTAPVSISSLRVEARRLGIEDGGVESVLRARIEAHKVKASGAKGKGASKPAVKDAAPVQAAPKSEPAPTPAPIPTSKPALRKPQVAVLKWLNGARQGQTRKAIAAGAKVDLDSCTSLVGSTDAAKRAVNDARYFPSLLTLGYASEGRTASDAEQPVTAIYSITPAGRKAIQGL